MNIVKFDKLVYDWRIDIYCIFDKSAGINIVRKHKGKTLFQDYLTRIELIQSNLEERGFDYIADSLAKLNSIINTAILSMTKKDFVRRGNWISKFLGLLANASDWTFSYRRPAFRLIGKQEASCLVIFSPTLNEYLECINSLDYIDFPNDIERFKEIVQSFLHAKKNLEDDQKKKSNSKVDDYIIEWREERKTLDSNREMETDSDFTIWKQNIIKINKSYEIFLAAKISLNEWRKRSIKKTILSTLWVLLAIFFSASLIAGCIFLYPWLYQQIVVEDTSKYAITLPSGIALFLFDDIYFYLIILFPPPLGFFLVRFLIKLAYERRYEASICRINHSYMQSQLEDIKKTSRKLDSLI